MQKWTTRFFEEEGLMSNYVILENVADERGESAAKVARTLFRLGCDLYLHLDESKGLRTCEVKYEVLGEGWAETKIVTPGYFPLLPESTTETIKRIGSNNFSIEGLIFVNKFEDGKTFNLRFGKDDSSVSIVAKKSDIDLLPPPSKYQTAPVSMSPAPPEKFFFDDSEEITTSGKRKPHTFYIATVKKDGTKRGDAWNKLKRLASESKGAKQIELNGFGKIYLKRDRENPETVLRYKHTEFMHPNDGNQITKGAFNMAWTAEKQSKKKGNR